MPTKLPGPRDFNDLAGVDWFTLGDIHGNTKQFINTVCLGSSYHIVAEVLSNRPDAVLDAFLSSWVSWAGVPRDVLTDGGGEFNREVSEELSDIGCSHEAHGGVRTDAEQRRGTTRRTLEIGGQGFDPGVWRELRWASLED